LTGSTNSPASSAPFDALGERIEQPVIALHEGEGLVVLDDTKTIEAIAFGRKEELLAEKIVRALGGDEDHLRVGRYATLVVLEIHHADEVAADRSRREQRSRERDVEAGVPAERDVELGAGRTLAVERRRDLAGGYLPARNGAGGHERLPRLAAEGIDIERRRRRSCGGGARYPRTQHQACGDGDRRAHGARADGRAGHEIGRQDIGAAAQRPARFPREKSIKQVLA
jgi:hypothetical protein